MLYRIMEKAAYSQIGKFAATAIRNKFYPNCRVHWVQQGLAEMDLDKVRKAQARY